MNEYALTKEDLDEIGHRMARGESCIIPIRQDWPSKTGAPFENMLTWGSPKAYEIVKVPQVKGVKYYGRMKK